jgi:hypothetical protein
MQNRKSCKPKYKYKYLEMKIKKRLRTDKNYFYIVEEALMDYLEY